MKMKVFAVRTTKEILRDPVNLSFGIGFPVILLLLMTAIQSNIPVSLFELGHLTPGVSIFSLSFLALFSGIVIAKDRSSSLLARLFTSPLTSSDFIFGYSLPLIPMALAQAVICYLCAFVLGMKMTVNVLLAIILVLPAAVVFIAIGLLCGSVLNDKQVGGICGALLTNVSAWLSGIWFDLDLIGGAFKKISYLLPFAHSVDMCRDAISGNFDAIPGHLLWVCGYAAVLTALAIIVFNKKMKAD